MLPYILSFSRYFPKETPKVSYSQDLKKIVYILNPGSETEKQEGMENRKFFFK